MLKTRKFDPFRLVKIASKSEKLTNRDYNLSSTVGDQDASACKIACHSLEAFSRKCPETTNLTHSAKWKWRPKKENQQTMTKI